MKEQTMEEKAPSKKVEAKENKRPRTDGECYSAVSWDHGSASALNTYHLTPDASLL